MALAGRWDTTGVWECSGVRVFKAGVRVCSEYGLGWKMGYYRGKGVFRGKSV